VCGWRLPCSICVSKAPLCRAMTCS
jgi:hypothetical protein